MAYDQTTLADIRRGRGNFLAMAATYGLGVFNDSFFRQAAILLAVAGGRTHLQGWIMSVFALPYLLFAPPAGWLADRFAKRKVVIAAKVLELAAMGLGAYGICALNWWFILGMVFTMGLQSCLFSPALNGSIPELYPGVYVTKANATLKVVVTAMILAGISAAAVARGLSGPPWLGVPIGRVSVAVGAVLIAATGLAVSFGVPRRPAAAPKTPFPWSGPWDTVRQFARIRRDRTLTKVVVADIYVWFAGTLLQLFIPVMAIRQFGWGESIGGYLVAAQVVGVAIGGVLVSTLRGGLTWSKVLPPAMGGMAAALGLMELTAFLPGPWALGLSFALLGVTGILGGMVLIPCEAFVQLRPQADRKGVVLAAVNFGVFAGILLAGLVANEMNRFLTPSRSLAVTGVTTALMAVGLGKALAKETME